MRAVVVPIPRARDLRSVRPHAGRMAEFRPDAAERHLAQQLRVQREAMQRRGIAAKWIADEVASLEAAIRAELATYLRKSVR